MKNVFKVNVQDSAEQPNLDIILKAKKGDLGAFDRLVRRYQSFVFSLAVRFLCDDDEAQDIVQESFVRVWKHFDRYDPAQKFTTWLYKIATNLCLDRLRAVKRKNLIFSSNKLASEIQTMPDKRDLEQIHSNRELVAIIKKLSGHLPEKQQLVFTLRDLQDLSVEEVVEITGLSRESVKTNLHYARRAIRELLEQQYDIRGT